MTLDDLEALYAGKRVLYRFTPRGGYGYTMRGVVAHIDNANEETRL